jgi:hypothetical protein
MITDFLRFAGFLDGFAALTRNDDGKNITRFGTRKKAAPFSGSPLEVCREGT